VEHPCLAISPPEQGRRTWRVLIRTPVTLPVEAGAYLYGGYGAQVNPVRCEPGRRAVVFQNNKM
jgi:hypothetical protein